MSARSIGRVTKPCVQYSPRRWIFHLESILVWWQVLWRCAGKSSWRTSHLSLPRWSHLRTPVTSL